MRREKDLLVVTSELSQADLLSAHLDGALQHQAELLAQAQAQLVQGDAAAGEQRELRVRAEHEASELRMLLDAAAARQRSAQAEVERLSKAMAVQGEELRAVADKLHAHRDSESKAFATRRSIWERTVEEWLTSGFNKRIDPLVYNANKDVFARLQELLGEEQAQREAQSSYLAHASSAELETLRASLGSRIRELEAQNDELMRERFDFGEKLSQSLTAYLKDEIATRDAKIVRLESQLSKTHGTLKELRVAQDEGSRQLLANLQAALAPLSAQVGSLQENAAELHRSRQELAEDDPRSVIERQQRLVDEAQAQAKRDRLARDKLAAELDGERAEHAIARQQLEMGAKDMASRSMEFGEKEYYQVTVGHLQELQRAKDDEIAALNSEHSAKTRELDEERARLQSELDAMRNQRQTQSSALANYASQEAEWSSKVEGLSAQLAKLQKDNRALKKRASRLPGLEKQLAELEREDVARLKLTVQQLDSRLLTANEQLAQMSQGKQQLEVELEELRMEQEANVWMANEQFAEKEDVLRRQARRLKEGLAMRVLRQWLLRNIGRCFKAWSIYVVRKQIRREARTGAQGSFIRRQLRQQPDSSDDEQGPSRGPSRSQSTSVPPQQRIADAINGLANFF